MPTILRDGEQIEVDEFGRPIKPGDKATVSTPDTSTAAGLQMAAQLGQIPFGKPAPQPVPTVAPTAPTVATPTPPPPTQPVALNVPTGAMDLSGLPPADGMTEATGTELAGLPAPLGAKSIQTTTASIQGTKPSAKTMAEIRAADKELVKAAEEGTRIAMAKAAEDETLARQKQVLAEQKAEADAEFEARRSARMNKVQETIASKVAEADAAKVDPGRFFAEKGTMGRIGAAFAVALGAYSSAYTGKENYALKIINDAIDRDINAQREDKDTKNQAVLRARAEFDDLRTTFGDEKLAKDALHIQKLTAVANSWEANVAKLGSAEAKQKGMAASAQLRAEIAQRTAQLEKDAQDKVSSTTVVTLEPSKPRSALSKEEADTALTLSQRYEQDQQTKDGRTMLTDADKVQDLVKSARAGNKEASAALAGLWARYVNGPGVLTQSDFDRAKLAGGVWESANSKISRGLFGELTEPEIQAAARVRELFRAAGNRLIAQASKRYMNLSSRFGIPNDMVVADPQERSLGIQRPEMNSEKAAAQLGLKKSGEKSGVAVAQK